MEDYNLDFQSNKEFGMWRYHQKTAKLMVKHVISPLGVNPQGRLKCQTKEKII